MTRIIADDFENKKLYIENFIHRQTSIAMIDKIMWEKYYTDSCSVSVIILNNVATPKNCTITRWQTTLLKASAQTLVRNSDSFVSDDCLQTVRHRTDEILQWSKNWSPRFPKTTFKCRQRLLLLAGINSCNRRPNAPNVFYRRQIWRKPIFLSNVMKRCFSTRWSRPLMCVHEQRPAETIHHECWKTALSQLSRC